MTTCQDSPLATVSLGSVERFCSESFVRHAEYFDILGSTSDRAVQLASRADLLTPALVVAGRQLAGRGRGGKSWWAGDGALTFSVVLDTPSQGIIPRDWPKLSLAAAVAVCDAIATELPIEAEAGAPAVKVHNQDPYPESRTLNPNVSLKWPNDVLIDGRKVCGILIESPGGAAPAKDRLVVGVGINVNNSWQSAPRELAASGTSLCDVSGRQHDLAQSLLGVLRKLEARLLQLAGREPQLWLAWKQLDWLRGRRVSVENGGCQVEGICLEIGEDGAIVLDTADGGRRLFSGSLRELAT